MAATKGRVICSASRWPPKSSLRGWKPQRAWRSWWPDRTAPGRPADPTKQRCLSSRLRLSLQTMTSLDAGGIATSGGVRFLGQRRSYWRLLIRGAVMLFVTLGIYRFWLVTDVRRFLWSNTEIAGETLEYTGTALELLLGFLVAISLLIPVYGGIFLAALDLGILGKLSGVLAFAALGVLGQYAIYRARRYRLTRTIYRGLRFHQTGSAWTFAFRAVLWWIITGLSAGLAYPF